MAAEVFAVRPYCWCASTEKVLNFLLQIFGDLDQTNQQGFSKFCSWSSGKVLQDLEIFQLDHVCKSS